MKTSLYNPKYILKIELIPGYISKDIYYQDFKKKTFWEFEIEEGYYKIPSTPNNEGNSKHPGDPVKLTSKDITYLEKKKGFVFINKSAVKLIELRFYFIDGNYESLYFKNMEDAKKEFLNYKNSLDLISFDIQKNKID